MKKFFFLSLLFSALLIAACKKKNAEELVQSGANSLRITPTETDTTIKANDKLPRYNAADGLICVLFGHGFNEDEFLEDAISKLKEKYGLESEGGIILPVVFEHDTEETFLRISKISNLYDIVNEHNIKGIILLGAPDGTHKQISKLRNDWNGKTPYAIFSFMPQDDPLGEEFNCDFVLEYERKASLEEEEVEVKTIDKTAEQIVLRAVRYMEDLPSPLPSDLDLHSHVQSIVGEKKVRRYTDGETGIQAINHFVIEQD